MTRENSLLTTFQGAMPLEIDEEDAEDGNFHCGLYLEWMPLTVLKTLQQNLWKLMNLDRIENCQASTGSCRMLLQ